MSLFLPVGAPTYGNGQQIYLRASFRTCRKRGLRGTGRTSDQYGSRYPSGHPQRHHVRPAVPTIGYRASSPLVRGMTPRRSKGNWSDESKVPVAVLRQRSLRRARHCRRGLLVTVPTSVHGTSRFVAAIHRLGSTSASNASIASRKSSGNTAWSMHGLSELHSHSSMVTSSSTTGWIAV